MRKVFPVMLFFLGIGFMVIGFMKQEHTVVLNKAVKICLECIGVG